MTGDAVGNCPWRLLTAERMGDKRTTAYVACSESPRTAPAKDSDAAKNSFASLSRADLSTTPRDVSRSGGRTTGVPDHNQGEPGCPKTWTLSIIIEPKWL